MRRVNLRFMLATILFVLVAAGAVHGVHTMQYRKYADKWKLMAEEAKQRSDTAQQIDYLRRYTALEKNDLAAFEELGNLLIESKRFREAQLPLATALSGIQAASQSEGKEDKSENTTRLRRELVKVALETGRWPDAEVQLEVLIDKNLPRVTRDKDQAEYHEQRAECRIGVGKWEDAVFDLDYAIGQDPTRCKAYKRLAEVYALELHSPEKAVEQLDAMVANNPESADAYRFRAELRYALLGSTEIRAAEATRKSGPGAPALTTVELLKLATEDARRAQELAPDSVKALTVSMLCNHAMSKLAEPEEAKAYGKEAASIAHQVIANSEAELQRRIEDYEEKHRPRSAPSTGDGETVSAAASDAAVRVPDAIARRWRLEVYSDAVAAYNTLADRAVHDGDPKKAIEYLETALAKVEIDKDFTLPLNIALLKIAVADQSGTTADIEREKQLLNQRRKSEPLARFLNGRQLISRGEWHAALRELQDVRGAIGGWAEAQAEADLGIANCLMKVGRYQVAERTYRQILQADPTSLPAKWGLATALEQQNRGSQESQALLLQVAAQRGVNPADPSFPELFARIVGAMIGQNAASPPESDGWKPAVAFVAETRAKAAALGSNLPQSAAETLDVMEAQMCLARKENARAVELLNTAVQRNPSSTASWIALAAVHDSEQQWDVAAETLKQAEAAIGTDDATRVAQLKLSKAMHELYRLSATLQKPEKTDGDLTAEQVRSDVIALHQSIPPLPDSQRINLDKYVHVKDRFAMLCATLGDSQTAEEIYKQIGALDANHLQSRIARLDLAWRRNNQDVDVQQVIAEIAPILEEIKAIDGTDGPVWNFGEATRLALTAAGPDKRRTLDAAEARLRTAERSWQGSVRVRRLRSFIYRLQDRLSDAVDLDLEVAREGEGYATPEFISRLVQDLYILKRYEDAADILSRTNKEVTSKLIDIAPTVMSVSGSGALRDERQSKQLRDLAVQLSQANVEQQADNFRARLAHGVMLLRANDATGARAQFEAARDMAPEEPEPWIVLIELDVQEGKLDSARQTLERAAQSIRSTDRPIALARGYNLVDEPEKVRQYVEEALAAVPKDLTEATPLQVEVLFRAAEAFLQRAQKEELIARQIAEKQPETSQQHRQAAIQMDAMGIDLLKRFVTDGEKARAELSAPRKESEPDPKANEHAVLLKQLTTQLPVVRRRLSLALLAKGGTKNQEEARRILDNNRVSGELLPEDARLRAIILSQSPAHSHKQEALSLLQKLIRETPAPRDEDRLLAATLHLSEYRRLAAASQPKPGADPETPVEISQEARLELDSALGLFRDIILVHQSDPQLNADGSPAAPKPLYVQAMVGLVEILLQNKDLAQAEFYVGQLTQLAPDSQAAIGAITSLYFQQGAIDAAVEATRRFAEGGPEEQRAGRRFAASQLLESFGQRSPDKDTAQKYFDESEKLLLELTTADVQGELLLAAFRGRRGRAEEAIAAIETGAAKGSDVQLTSASVYAMRAAGTDRNLLKRLESALERALIANPNSVPLKLMLADLHTWLGEYDAGEQMYREVIAQNPRHAAAANNLAFLLASQRRAPDESLDLINRVINEQGQLAELLDTRAYVYISRGEAKKAIEDLVQALAETTQTTYLYHQAQALLALNRQAEAKAVWDVATKQGLSETTIHPLERQEYRDVASKLANK